MGVAAAGLAAMQVASTGLKVAGAMQEGRAAKVEGQIKAIRSETVARAAETRAQQTSASYEQSLATGLANLMAIGAGQGVGVDSATRMALAQRGEDLSDYRRDLEVSNQKLAAIGARGDAEASRTAGQRAMAAASLRALMAGVSGASGLASIDWNK